MASSQTDSSENIPEELESRHGEELVRVEDHGAYTIAIVVHPDEPREARGPFAYGVKWEPNIDDEEGRYKWHYLGKAHDSRAAEMAEPLFGRVVVPVANRDDAAATATTLRSYIAMDTTEIAAHVIEKAGGAPDKASVEQREQRAAEILSIITEGFDDSDVIIETDLRYGTEIAPSIVGTAHDRGASANVFTPRDRGRWRKLMTDDITDNLVESGDIPIPIVSEHDESEV